MKKRVIRFFVLLLIFAGVLTYIGIARFGGLSGFVSFNNASSEKAKEGSSEIVTFFVIIFLFVLIAGFILKYLEKHGERGHEHSYHEADFKRKFITFE